MIADTAYVQARHTLASISYLQGPSRETVPAHQSPWGWDGWQGVKGMAGWGEDGKLEDEIRSDKSGQRVT